MLRIRGIGLLLLCSFVLRVVPVSGAGLWRFGRRFRAVLDICQWGLGEFCAGFEHFSAMAQEEGYYLAENLHVFYFADFCVLSVVS